MPPLGPQHAKQAINTKQQMVQNPVSRDQATEQITKIINDSGMPVHMFVEIGKLAEQSIENPKKYKDFVNYMVSKKLEKAETMKKPDYQMLASLVVIGKVAQTLPDNTAKIPGPVSPTQGL